MFDAMSQQLPWAAQALSTSTTVQNGNIWWNSMHLQKACPQQTLCVHARRRLSVRGVCFDVVRESSLPLIAVSQQALLIV